LFKAFGYFWKYLELLGILQNFEYFIVITRIYISENLTKHNREIFDAALNLKKDGKLVSVSTFHGTVSVKLAPTDRPKQIMCLADLDSFFTSNGKD
jgi:hypothetical protein